MPVLYVIRNSLLAGILISGAAFAQQNAAPSDNTKTNLRDRESGAITADKQKMDQADEEIARRIRRLVVTDKNLSLYAHNAKIIVRDGNVILRGPVRSEQERNAIVRKAASVAGENKVINQLDVAPRKS